MTTETKTEAPATDKVRGDAFDQYVSRSAPAILSLPCPDGMDASRWAVIVASARAHWSGLAAYSFLEALAQGFRLHELSSGVTDGTVYARPDGSIERGDPRKMNTSEYAEANRWATEMRSVNKDYSV